MLRGWRSGCTTGEVVVWLFFVMLFVLCYNCRGTIGCMRGLDCLGVDMVEVVIIVVGVVLWLSVSCPVFQGSVFV